VHYCVASCINHLGLETRSIITSWCRAIGSGHRHKEEKKKRRKRKRGKEKEEKGEKEKGKRKRGEENEEREASARFVAAVGHARELRRSAGKRCTRIEEEQRDGMVIGTGVRATNRRKRFEFGDEKILKNIFSE
jgi:hypothetical protein